MVQPIELAFLPPQADAGPTRETILNVTATPEAGTGEIGQDQNSQLPLHAGSSRPPIAVSSYLFPLWLIGVIYFVSRTVLQWYSIRKLLRSNEYGVTDDLVRICREEACRLGIRRLPRLQLSSRVASPILIGILRPSIILPIQGTKTFDETDLRMILSHELAHLQRCDLAWNWLPTVASWLFFFHPLVWFMVRRWSEVQETACDEVLIQRRSVQPAAYGRLLVKLSRLSLAEHRSGLTAAGVLGTYRNLERRILAMTQMRLYSARRIRLVTVIVVLAGTVCMIPWRLTAKGPSTAPTFHDWPITVTGRAVTQDGNPIEGTTIFIVALNASPDTTLAQTTTDREGRYVFRDAHLPIHIPTKPTNDYAEGTFQIFGKAPGHGFSWFGMKTMFVDPRFIAPDGTRTIMQPQLGYFPGDKIAIDLLFSPAETISGRFVDERGKPIANVNLAIESCDYAELAGRETNDHFRNFRAINQAVHLMPDQLSAMTNANGRFTFKSIPPGVICSFSATHPKFGHRSFSTATVDPLPGEINGEKIESLPISMTMQRAKTISATVIFADTKKAAGGALLVANAQSGTAASASDYCYCGKDGKAMLKLPPGEYSLSTIPTEDMDYVQSTSKLVVKETDGELSRQIQLNVGCVLILKAVDAKTGAGIKDVDFWFSDDAYPWSSSGVHELGKHWSVQSNTITNDFPKTDATGTVRAVVFPGSRVYGVGVNRLPDGYHAQVGDNINGRKLDVPAGQTVTAEFLLQR